jgi:hypothetical protein
VSFHCNITSPLITDQGGQVSVTKQLIESRFNIDSEGEWLHTALHNGPRRTAIELIKADCNITSLLIVTQEGHASVTKQLIKSRFNIDLQKENGYTPLYIVAQEGILPSTD